MTSPFPLLCPGSEPASPRRSHKSLREATALGAGGCPFIVGASGVGGAARTGPAALAAGLTCQSSLTSPLGSSRLSDASRAGSPGVGVRPNSSEPSAWEMAQSAWKVTGPQCALRTLRRIGGQPGRSEWKLSGAHSAGRGHGNKHFCHQPKCSCQQKLLPSRVQIAGQEGGERGERKWRCRPGMHRAADPNWGWARPTEH